MRIIDVEDCNTCPFRYVHYDYQYGDEDQYHYCTLERGGSSLIASHTTELVQEEVTSPDGETYTEDYYVRTYTTKMPSWCPLKKEGLIVNLSQIIIDEESNDNASSINDFNF